MKILITGGAGFIGSHVVQALQAEHEVVIIDDFNDYYSPTFKRENIALLKPAAIYEADITNAEAIDAVFKKHAFDCIIHLAARAGVRPSIANPHIYTEVNVVGTTNILQAAAKYSVPRIIIGSTSAVYGNSSPVPFTETFEVSQPISPYAASKRSAELMAYTFHHLYHIKTTILRFFTVYGERGRPDMAPYLFTQAILRGTPIKKFGDGTTSRDYTYVADIIHVIVVDNIDDMIMHGVHEMWLINPSHVLNP
jgi:UDP-glucuronate 4-epimerase